MYICLDCEALFTVPEKYTETHGLDCPPYEEYSGCPNCGGTYAETFKCDRCGKYIAGDYVEVACGNLYCEDCYTLRSIGD